MTQVIVKPSRRFWWVWALLLVTLSYSYDVECFFEAGPCLQREAGTSATVAGTCIQPNIVSLVVALPPALPALSLPPQVEVFGSLPLWVSREAPFELFDEIPLGLRAPPLV